MLFFTITPAISLYFINVWVVMKIEESFEFVKEMLISIGRSMNGIRIENGKLHQRIRN